MKRLRLLLAGTVFVILLACGIGLATLGANQDKALGYFDAHLAKFYKGKEVVARECQPHDSDNDHYVSCTATLEGLENPVGRECVATWWWQRKWSYKGCRIPKLQSK